MSAPAAAPAGEVRRPLGAMERWYWVCDQISPLNVIARVHVAGACAPVDLDRAARRLVEEHPLLRVAVAADPDGGNPRFVAAPDPRIPVRRVRREPADVRRWEREVDEVELAGPVDWRAGPLARIVDVVSGPPGTAEERHDLVLTVSHVIADGTTALELLRRLVELAAAEPPARTEHPAGPPSRPALPPVESLLPARINGMPRSLHLVAAVVADGIVAVLARPRRLAPLAPVPPEQRRTRLIRRELDGEQVAALVDRCRREGVTVHSALAAALAAAVLPELPAGQGRRVSIGSPVDFRTGLAPAVGRRDAGAYVATVPSAVPAGPGVELWTAARAALRDLRRRRRLGQPLALVSLLRLMSPASVRRSARAVDLVDRSGPGNVCLSNLGRHAFPDRVGPWQLSGAQFIAGISISGYLVATVNTSHDVLHWNFTYVDGALTHERAELIADRSVHLLRSSLRPSRAPADAGTRG